MHESKVQCDAIRFDILLETSRLSWEQNQSKFLGVGKCRLRARLRELIFKTGLLHLLTEIGEFFTHRTCIRVLLHGQLMQH